MRIAVLEPSVPPSLEEALAFDTDLEFTLSPPASVKFIDDIGVWDLIPRERKTPYTDMQVWDTVTRTTFALRKAMRLQLNSSILPTPIRHLVPGPALAMVQRRLHTLHGMMNTMS